MPGLFSPRCKCGRSISPRGGAWRVCVQSLGSPIFQLINFIFTHLFLNVLSDGNAADCSSEVLTWQMGLKGEVSQCQRQDFQFKVEGYFFFYYSWGVGIILRKLTHMASYCAPYTIQILPLISLGSNDQLNSILMSFKTGEKCPSPRLEWYKLAALRSYCVRIFFMHSYLLKCGTIGVLNCILA